MIGYISLGLSLLFLIGAVLYHYTVVKVSIAELKVRQDNMSNSLLKLEKDTQSLVKDTNQKLHNIETRLVELIGYLNGKGVMTSED